MPTVRTVAAIALVATFLAGCSTSRYDETAADPTTTTLPGASTVPAGSGDDTLSGMRGARPGVEVSAGFRRRIAGVDAEVTDFRAAAAGYDAVMLVAVAAEQARSDMPGRIADELVDVSRTGHTCVNFQRCRALALDDRDPDYDGFSGGIDLLDNGDPGEAGYEVVEFDRTGRLRTVDQLVVPASPLAERPAGADPTYGPLGDGKLTIGTLLPVLGPEGATARGALAGVRLAVDDVNDLGGVLGEPLVLLADESGDGSPTATLAAVRRIIDQGADAVVGGTTYAVTSAALGAVTEAGLVMVSPTDTARVLSVAGDRGLFFRVAAPTDLEGRVLGRVITDDGFTNVAIIDGPDDADTELASDITSALNSSSATVAANVPLGGDTSPEEAVQQALAANPQAIVLATSPQSTVEVVRALVAAGKGPRELPTYGTAANMTPELAAAVAG